METVFSPATARRLEVIERRNELRRGYLPTLNLVVELRRMYQQKLHAEFEHFAKPRRRALIDAEVERWRRDTGNPNWVPNSISGQGIGARVDTILWKKYLAAKN